MKTGILPASPPGHSNDRYEEFLDALRQTYATAMNEPLFMTDAEGLFEAFLDGFGSPELRQHYVCHACRDFFERFGGLVTIRAEDGVTEPLFWESTAVPELYRKGVEAVARLVRRARVTGVFLGPKAPWGKPETGPWHHASLVDVSLGHVYRLTLLKNAEQAMAEKKEEYGMLQRELAEFSRETVAKVLPLLESESLYRSEKCLGVAKWLLALHDARNTVAGRVRRENLTWRAVATAPPGWAHVGRSDGLTRWLLLTKRPSRTR